MASVVVSRRYRITRRPLRQNNADARLDRMTIPPIVDGKTHIWQSTLPTLRQFLPYQILNRWDQMARMPVVNLFATGFEFRTTVTPPSWMIFVVMADCGVAIKTKRHPIFNF